MTAHEPPNAHQVSGHILALLSQAQSQYFGEPVTQLEHALQCAHMARIAKADDEMVLAALLHDIGHLLAPNGELGAPDHDRAGADYLRDQGFSGRVVALIAGHVEAKRYLTATDASYAERLSEASRQTLRLQGGPMSAEEAAAFESAPLFREKLQLRVWDERAKTPGLFVEGVEFYRPLLEQQLSRPDASMRAKPAGRDQPQS
jgi:putative nucleotidyltransferase with HDIG domain